eukprot:TRINITY_DN1473_c0_g1_i1.p1 TRINITY_DN1473_c0_g1~~TRINITY_DN1473_c0_g1_i1.p1  ORF type:complete len:283 (+),score=94.67 TRINITY_DN1473_c0_g1_i1:92-940(+)
MFFETCGGFNCSPCSLSDPFGTATTKPEVVLRLAAEIADRDWAGPSPRQPAAATSGKSKAKEWQEERLKAKQWVEQQKRGALEMSEEETTEDDGAGSTRSVDLEEHMAAGSSSAEGASSREEATQAEELARLAREAQAAAAERIAKYEEARAAEAAAAEAEKEARAKKQLDLEKQELLNRERLRLERERLDQEQLHAFLVDNGFRDVNAKRKSLLKYKYPLHSAVKRNDANLARILIAAGADSCLRNSSGQTALDLAIKNNKHGSHAALLRELGHGHSVRCA